MVMLLLKSLELALIDLLLVVSDRVNFRLVVSVVGNCVEKKDLVVVVVLLVRDNLLCNVLCLSPLMWNEAVVHLVDRWIEVGCLCC